MRETMATPHGDPPTHSPYNGEWDIQKVLKIFTSLNNVVVGESW